VHSVRDRGVGGSNPLAPTNFQPQNIRKLVRSGLALVGRDRTFLGSNLYAVCMLNRLAVS
jgi:hypothetical protein